MKSPRKRERERERERERLCEARERELRRDISDGQFPSHERERKARGGEKGSERE